MFHLALTLLFGVLALDISFGFGTNEHLVCKRVEDDDDSSPSLNHTMPRLPLGPPGERGQMGVKGEPGPPGLKGDRGLPGIADPQNIKNIAEQKCREVNVVFRSRIDKVEQLVTKNDSSIVDSVEEGNCQGGFRYREKCYVSIIHDIRDVNHKKARAICADFGGVRADIMNQNHQKLLANHIRSNTSISVAIEAWLGMTYTTSTLHWSNGVKVPEEVADWVRWWGNYPGTPSNHDKIQFAVDSNMFGFINYRPNYKAHGVVCEM